MSYAQGNWAPVVLETLIHLHVYPRPLHESASTDAAVLALLRGELITHCKKSETHPDGLELTERGRAHLRMLCQMPYPDQRHGTWVLRLRDGPHSLAGGFMEIRP